MGDSPLKNFGAKKMQNLAWLRLWSRVYLGWDKISKIAKIRDLDRFLPHSANQIRWTLVHYLESSTCEFGPTQINFLGDYISATRGCWLPKFFIRATDWPRLASAQHTPGRVPQKILKQTFKIGLKIPHMRAYNFGGSGCNLTKLYQGTWFEAWLIFIFKN